MIIPAMLHGGITGALFVGVLFTSGIPAPEDRNPWAFALFAGLFLIMFFNGLSNLGVFG